MNYKLIGEQIRKYRKRLGLTQQQLGKEIGVSWEMISRYERGASSPLAKINKLAEALSVGPVDLLTEVQSSVREGTLSSQIPLFTTIPRGFDFSNKVGYYYSAPEWIIQTDKEAFAIDPTIVEAKNVQISGNGPLFISPTSQPTEGDLVVYKDGSKLVVDKFSGTIESSTVVGIVLAQERRFVE
ncbi:MAG: helix-turn-helix transcriptional regulator [Candidatus Dojkabacteria bacterium]|nr:MAG: helix-turn-helix transcriptional regulator [Candidatus Dojkabacteria bacterium]